MAAKIKPGVKGRPAGYPPIGLELAEDQLILRSREAEIVRLRDAEGLTSTQIAERLGVNISTIHADYQRMSDRLVAEQTRLFPRWRIEHVGRMYEVRQKCLREFEISKKAKLKRLSKRTVTGEAGVDEQVSEEINETGNPRFLEVAQKYDALLAEALGLAGGENLDEVLPIQTGLVSGPVITIPATAVVSDDKLKAAIERFEQAARRRLVSEVDKKEGTG